MGDYSRQWRAAWKSTTVAVGSERFKICLSLWHQCSFHWTRSSPSYHSRLSHVGLRLHGK